MIIWTTSINRKKVRGII